MVRWSLEHRSRGVVRKDDRAHVREAEFEVVALKLPIGRPDIHPEPTGTADRRAGPGPVE